MTTQIIESLPFKEYLAHPAVSMSTLEGYIRTASEGRYKEINGIKESSAIKVGRYAHASLLEPSTVQTDFATALDLPKRSNADKAAHLEFELLNAGKTILSAEESEKGWNTARAVEDTQTWEVIRQDLRTEISLFFEIEGLKCRARLDGYSERLKAIIELKTTTDPSEWAFGKTCADFGYHRKAAFYLMAAEACGLDAQVVAFVAAGTTPPYLVGFYSLTPDALAVARGQALGLIAKYKECSEKGEYPGLPDELRTLSLPKYAITGRNQGEEHNG